MESNPLAASSTDELNTFSEAVSVSSADAVSLMEAANT
jgi:hypothetical protein